MVRIDYGSQTFDQDKIIGFLFSNGYEQGARFIVQDSRQPDTALFSYNGKGEMSFPGLAAIARGELDNLRDHALTKPEAVRTLLYFGHVNGRDLYSLMLDNKNPAALKSTLDIIRDVFEENAFGFIKNGLLPYLQGNNVSAAGLEQLKAISEAAKLMVKTPDEEKYFSANIARLASQKISSGFNTGSGSVSLRSVNELQKIFTDTHDVLGDELGGQVIKAGLPGLIARQAKATGALAPQLFQAVLEEAEKSGTGAQLLEILRAKNSVGQGLVDEVAMSYGTGGILSMIVDKVAALTTVEDNQAWLKQFLNAPRGYSTADVSSGLQGVRRALKQDSPSWKLVSDVIEAFSYYSNVVPAEGFRQAIVAARPVIEGYLAANPAPAGDRSALRDAEALEKFIEKNGPVMDGPSILAYVPLANLERLLEMKARADGLDRAQLADALYHEFSQPKNARGETAMHRGFAGSRVLGPPSSENGVDESLSEFIVTLDRIFGTDIAVPLASKLFAVKDAEGSKPLESTLYDGPQGQYGRYYYPAMVKGLAAALNDEVKFGRYMDEAIVPNLPVEFGGGRRPVGNVQKYLVPGPG